MTESRKVARWFFAAMLAVPAIQNVFSYAGLSFLGPISLRLNLDLASGFLASPIGYPLILMLGLGTVAILAFLAVARWNAPRELWYVPLAYSLLQLAHLGYSVGLAWLMGGLAEPSQVASQVMISVPFLSPYAYFGSAIGYPLAAWIGCRLGAGRNRAAVDAPEPGPA